MPRLAQQVYLTTSFRQGASSHGGHHRFQQLRQSILDGGLSIAGAIKAAPRSSFSRSQILQITLAGLCQYPFLALGTRPSVTGMFRIGVAALAARQLKSPGTFLWAPSYGAHLVLGRLARARGMRVIAVIHNLESLVPNQPCPIRPSQRDWLDLELRLLADAEVVFCHSRWDQWFLRLRGIDARLLPYFPAATRYEALHQVRVEREASAPAKLVVVLGNALNPPTKLGMVSQIAMLKRHAFELNGIDFHFCGEGTKEIGSMCDIPNTRFHGYVDEATLQKLLVSARAVWFHQPATTGVVTRIADMLVAGVPVVANSFAARSYEEADGVYGYDLDQLFPRIISTCFASPRLPEPPDVFIAEFVDTIAGLRS